MQGDIRKVGVIGAGQMGSGIAHVCALAGFDVVIHDVSEERVQSGLATIHGNSLPAGPEGQRHGRGAAGALALINGSADINGLADCDLVVEAATENEEVKRKIFQSVTRALKPDAILATNTSSISITRLGAATDRPEQFIGIHF